MRFIGAFVVSAIAFFIAAAPIGSASDGRWPDYPKALRSAKGLVSEEIAVKIATEKARELWGEVQVGVPILCTDAAGVINCYMVPFRLGNERFPGKDEVFRSRKDSMNRINELLGSQGKGGVDNPEVDESGMGIDETDLGGARGGPAESVVPRNFEKSLKTQHEAELAALTSRIRDMAEDTKYGTVLVSARRDQFPIPAVFHFLPPFFITGADGRQVAGEALHSTNCDLINIIFLGPGQMYYRYANGSRNVLVDCKTLQLIDNSEEFLMKASEAPTMGTMGESGCTFDLNAEIEKAWQEVMPKTQD